MTPLADLRRTNGLRVAVCHLEDVFDQFGGGRASTDAIRRFLSWAWEDWPAPALRYVLLVGDATYDPQGNLGHSDRQVVPTRLVETTYFQTASDLGYADVENDDGIAELAIGRLPVATLQECQIVVQKLLAYEVARGPWRARTLFVGDDDPDFSWMNQEIEELVPGGQAIFLNLITMEIDELRDTLFAEWGAGTRIVHYSGHGGRKQWSAAGILHVDDVAQIQNGDRLPVVLAMNCLNGFFHHPESPSLGEALVLEPSGGAIAYWGSSAITSNIRQQTLVRSFYKSLFDSSVETLGDAIREALAELAADPKNRDVVLTWVLLGDPALPWN